MIRYSSDFIRLLENLQNLRDRLLWLPLSSDDTEESLFGEICTYIDDYKHSINIQNPCPVGDKTDFLKEVD